MKTVALALSLTVAAFEVQAATVQLDWISGSLHLPSAAIGSVSSVYNAWPDKGIGLYKEKGFEVMLYGDFGYHPALDGIPVVGPGFIASNDPGIVQASVAQTISRADGRRFSLTSLDTDVGANQVYMNYYYSHPDGTSAFDLIESASFDVVVQGDGGGFSIDPFSHEYDPLGDLVRRTKTTTDFGGIGTNSSFIGITSAGSGQTLCDARVLSQASSVVQAVLPCSDPTYFGATNIFKMFPDGSQIGASQLNDVGSQNWAWTFNYRPTFSVDMMAVPLPGAAWALGLAFVGLVGVGRKRAA